MGIVEILLGTKMANFPPANGVVGLSMKFFSQLLNKRRDRADKFFPVQVRHGHVNHPTVAPHLSWMHGEERRQDPELRGHWVASSPFKNAEDREPSLAPGGYVGHPAMVMNPLPGPSTSIVLATIGPFPKNAHAYVAQGGAEHGAVTFDVQAPSTIFILVVVDVAENLFAMLGGEDGVKVAGDVDAHDQGREEEERAGVLGRPMTVASLQGGEEMDGPLQRGGRLVVGDLLAILHPHWRNRLLELLLPQELHAPEEVATGLDLVAVVVEVLPSSLDLRALLSGASLRVELPNLSPHVVVGAVQVGTVLSFCYLQPPHSRSLFLQPIILRLSVFGYSRTGLPLLFAERFARAD